MNNRIKIVTDSTSDLPPPFVKENGIHVIPLYVNFDHGTYRDGVDLTANEFYPLLNKAKENLPKTSTPTRDNFVETYQQILDEGYEIISLHISSGLSGTYSIACSAAEALDGKIRVFDSKSISLGIGLQVLETVNMVKQGFHMERILCHLEELRQRTEVIFSLDTLEYLQKGGRIGKVSALLGNILNIKPVIRVENGIYVPIDKVRNQSQAIKKIVEHMARILGNRRPHQVAVAHGAAGEAANSLIKLVETTFKTKIVFLQETGPVIGVHTGPGTLGLGFTY